MTAKAADQKINIEISDDDALIIVDLQPDFMPGGNLPVDGGNEIIDDINDLIPLFKTVVGTQDWHPKGHKSFASAHDGKQPYDLFEAPGLGPVLWPDHCIQGSFSADFHPNLSVDEITLILRKGIHHNIDSYSVFLENDKETETGLSGYLKSRGVKRVFMCGLALDYCVFYSAMDGINFGFEVFVISDLTRAVDSPPGHLERALSTMKEIGVKFIEKKAISA